MPKSFGYLTVVLWETRTDLAFLRQAKPFQNKGRTSNPEMRAKTIEELIGNSDRE